MPEINVNVRRVNDAFHFVATNSNGNEVHMDDATSYPEGIGQGAGPMQLLLMALGGCSGVDVVSILKKSRQPITGFDIDVSGTKPAGVAPSLYEEIRIHFKLTGDLDADRVRRAVELSLNKYCSVAKTLEPTARLIGAYSINGERYELG